MPTDTVLGDPVDAVRDRYLADGFQVETIDVDDPGAVLAANIAPDRIRLFVRAGRVVRAVQG